MSSKPLSPRKASGVSSCQRKRGGARLAILAGAAALVFTGGTSPASVDANLAHISARIPIVDADKYGSVEVSAGYVPPAGGVAVHGVQLIPAAQ
jgi:hypothetical protein